MPPGNSFLQTPFRLNQACTQYTPVTMKLLGSLLVIFGVWLAAVCALPVAEDQVQQPAESVLRAQRQAGGGNHHEAVDFGAHTGEHGSFGWYADFPVHHH